MTCPSPPENRLADSHITFSHEAKNIDKLMVILAQMDSVVLRSVFILINQTQSIVYVQVVL